MSLKDDEVVAELTYIPSSLGGVMLTLETGVFSDRTAISALLRRWMDMYVKPEHDRTEDEQAVMTKQIVLQSDQYGNLGKRSYSAALILKLPNDLHINRINKDTHALRIVFPEGTNLIVKSQFRATLEAEWRKQYPNATVTVWARDQHGQPLPQAAALRLGLGWPGSASLSVCHVMVTVHWP